MTKPGQRLADGAPLDAEAAYRAPADVLAVMSHELRTPLNAIGGYVELMEMGKYGPITEAQHDALMRIDRSQRHILALVNSVLSLARIENGCVDYQLRTFDVGELIVGLAPMIEPQLAAKELSFSVSVPADGVLVRADSEKVAQILLNVLSNAMKFTPRGGTITLRVDRSAAGDMCRVAVSDTGTGIPLAKQDVIFEPFVQVHTIGASTSEGAGLGLAISRDLARGMAGELTVASVDGQGSTFTLTLPVVAAEAGAIVESVRA